MFLPPAILTVLSLPPPFSLCVGPPATPPICSVLNHTEHTAWLATESSGMSTEHYHTEYKTKHMVHGLIVIIIMFRFTKQKMGMSIFIKQTNDE